VYSIGISGHHVERRFIPTSSLRETDANKKRRPSYEGVNSMKHRDEESLRLSTSWIIDRIYSGCAC